MNNEPISGTLRQKIRSCGNNCPPKQEMSSAIHSRYWIWQVKYIGDSGGSSWKQ